MMNSLVRSQFTKARLCVAQIRMARPTRQFSQLAGHLELEPWADVSVDRKTKIVATIGPATLPHIEDVIRAGASVARINCSHGDASYYRSVVGKVRSAVENIREYQGGHIDFTDGCREDTAAIAFDTKGPEIRTGIFRSDVAEAALRADGKAPADDSGPEKLKHASVGNPELQVRRGDEVILTTDGSLREAGSLDGGVFVDYPYLVEQAAEGQQVFIDDGLLALRVVSVLPGQDKVICRAENSAKLGERKGVSLPGVEVQLPAVSDKDREDLKLAKEMGADFVFASFIRNGDQVQEIQDLLGHDLDSPKVIAKIENKQGVDNFEDILRHCHGAMVARGDLAVEIGLERVFVAQKKLIAQCNVAGKPVICATQMLESMTSNPRPTRAEVVDVGSAVMDGADAVMLSGETAKGAFPVEAVRTMSTVCRVAERAGAAKGREGFAQLLAAVQRREAEAEAKREAAEGLLHMRRSSSSSSKGGFEGHLTSTESLAAAAVHTAYEQRRIRFIAAMTLSGSTAALLAKYRPGVPVIALTPSPAAARRLQMVYGVHALLTPQGSSRDETLQVAVDECRRMGLVEEGDRFLALLGKHSTHVAGDVSSMHVFDTDGF